MNIPIEKVKVSILSHCKYTDPLSFGKWYTNKLNSLIQMMDLNKWNVESVSGFKEDGYTVQLQKEGSECCTDSHIVCTQTGCIRLCYHMYSCSEPLML